MSYHDWYVGMKVVCVDAGIRQHPRLHNDMNGLEKGRVYTIREIGITPQPHPAVGVVSAAVFLLGAVYGWRS